MPELVTVPAPDKEPTVSEKPAMSNVAPLLMTKELQSAIRDEIPSVNVPAAMVVVPVHVWVEFIANVSVPEPTFVNRAPVAGLMIP